MANLTQSLSDSIRLYGIQPSTKWGTPMIWGTDKWGNGTNTHFNLPTRSTNINSDTTVLTDLFATPLRVFNSDSIGVNQIGINETLSNGKYLYVLRGGVTNDENAYVPVYVTSTVSAPTWTLSTQPAGSWT